MLQSSLRRRLLVGLATTVFLAPALISPASAAPQEAAQTTVFDIQAGTLDAALVAFATQSGRTVAYSPALVAGRQSSGLQGRFTPEAALDRLIAGAAIDVHRRGDKGFVLKPRRAGATPTAALETPAPIEGVTTDEPSQLSEIVVTGSLIRGPAKGASPVVTVSRDDLDRTGKSTVADMLTDLPQAFGGNASAGSGLNGAFADISTLPTAADDRVEVLLDGASALYGSDAVGGVVNVILRKDFDGAETRARVGGATGGGALKPQRRKSGYPARAVVAYPKPLWQEWEDPPTFSQALDLHMRRHSDTGYGLRRAVCERGETIETTTFTAWRRGAKAPRGAASLRILAALERRWKLPVGYFRDKLPHPSRMVADAECLPLPMSERRRMAWHLPDDFAQLPLSKRQEIEAWVRSVILSGHTDYRRYQSEAMKQRFAFQFSGKGGLAELSAGTPLEERLAEPGLRQVGRPLGAAPAPAKLDEEAGDLLAFKTATLTSRGRRRNGVWNRETAGQKMEHLGLMLGALAACPEGAVRGYGAPVDAVSFGLLVFPAVWDWYLEWREGRRGFFTQWETEMLTVGASLSRRETGWLRQTPRLAERLRSIEGLVSAADVRAASEDWDSACDAQHRHLLLRAKEVARVARIHRDPFEPILPILEADSPVGAYRKITEEILRRRPDGRLYPTASAEATRAFLMLRLGLHLGLRQKNLRQLLTCPKDRAPTPERQLEAQKRGELRWNARDTWEVLIPAAAFKNAGSSYFRKNPFRLALPDLGGLYAEIEGYIARDRPILLRGSPDPGVFLIKTMKAKSKAAEYDQNTFYEAWRLAIQRYGIFNPYTGRGAIEGLLPHGPHNVRDVLATHVLKQTGSYEQASYAIQDTPDTIAEHYGRFLPQDKAALAAQVLNQVWA